MSPIAPITGTLKKKIIFDISVGFTIGGVLGAAWWWGFHVPKVNKREDYYAKLAKEKAAEQ
ncbi:HCL222Wp [Eremothecium sinecaudum]|uniref:Cytochrome c oxidase subunit 9, mitochondrial n=1 Tax=Eremothecium sinecaudum TaxID=45286 RepID=A0A0X8HR59_9SACH|nr:HCL222Wp [Eremothecium sinecaudum]AMD19929.1 HCL222Wp [Eremothecium sinecaudum]